MGSVSWEINFHSRLKGPISSGEIHDHVRDYEEDVTKALADEAKDTWLENLNSSLRHQRPYYTTQIHKKRLARNWYEIHDSGVIYGHWLEGTGSKNAPVTIFPGYWANKRAKGEMQAKRGNIARRILRRHRARGRLI